MEEEAVPLASGGGNDESADPSIAVEAKQSTPITNVILSQAVSTAISQLDTKRAFDMMLLNEQMSVMEAENKCLKEEATFLRESVAKQSQETSEMYHYFHGKLDAHVATITTLESDLAAARAENERLKEQHMLELASAQSNFDIELSKVNAEISNVRDELYQVHVFSTQKKEMEELVRELQEELDTKVKQFAAEKDALELKAMFEKDRVKKEMLVHMKDTKEALLLRTDEQLNTTTKRTMMENDHFMEELSFQSKETEKLLMRYKQVEEEVQRLRVTNKVLEENELAMAKKNHYYQKILGQLKKQGKEPEKQTLDPGDDVVAIAQAERQELHAARDEVARLKSKLGTLEETLKHAQQWIQAFQQEKQFVVAQQDEIIQFLCRVLSDATNELARRKRCSDKNDADATTSPRVLTVADAVLSTSSMEELVSLVPPIALDELSSDDTRYVVMVLLEKMKMYQDQVATIYRGRKFSPMSPLVASPKQHDASRDLLAKQLGVELPPIAQSVVTVTSPLKVKRRIQPHAPSAANLVRPPPANQDILVPQQSKTKGMSEPAGLQNALSANGLLSVATSHFNFLQPTSSPVKKPPPTHKQHSLSPTKLGPRIGPRRDRDPPPEQASTDDEADGLSLAASGSQPSAWSTDSLPVYDKSLVADPLPQADGRTAQQKNASASRRKG